ncbi:MAG: DUF5698 domain-containing protein [Bacilli bacterium]|jgi:uncharacterized protein YebE (UPF0316 family)
MWDALSTLGTWGIVLEILIIFFAKIVEVTIGTLRQILVVKGYRITAVLLALAEIFLWVFIASKVITGLADNWLNGVAYGLGFAAGVYFGSIIEQKLAFGMLLVQTITTEKKGIEIANSLREKGYGVTTVDAKGKVDSRKILMVYANRRGSAEIVEQVMLIDPTAMIVTNDVGTLSGGYIHIRKSLLK